MARENFAVKLRIAAARANLSQKKIADACGLSSQSINALWHGRTEPTFATAIKIARALGVDLAELVPDDTEEEEAEAVAA